MFVCRGRPWWPSCVCWLFCLAVRPIVCVCDYVYFFLLTPFTSIRYNVYVVPINWETSLDNTVFSEMLVVFLWLVDVSPVCLTVDMLPCFYIFWWFCGLYCPTYPHYLFLRPGYNLYTPIGGTTVGVSWMRHSLALNWVPCPWLVFTSVLWNTGQESFPFFIYIQ